MVFLNCNLDTRQESYGLENKGISRGTGISRATGNSRNSGIPKAQAFPARFLGNENFPGISHSWFPVEHPWLGSGQSRLKCDLCTWLGLPATAESDVTSTLLATCSKRNISLHTASSKHKQRGL